MKKVILSLVFVLSFTSLTIAIDKNKSEPDIEGCHKAASELAGLLAIYNNNSFEEEEDDYNYLMTLCLEAN